MKTYPGRMKSMLEKRADEATLQTIGDHFEISRQRVLQIIGKTRGGRYGPITISTNNRIPPAPRIDPAAIKGEYTGKYVESLAGAVREFWLKNHYPPTLRDLMAVTGIPSTSVARYVVRRLPNVRVTDTGRIIPEWVDSLFAKHTGEESA